MALIWLRIQHTGFGHPALSVTSSVKLKNLSFVLALVTAVMMVSVLKRFMRKEQNNSKFTKNCRGKDCSQIVLDSLSGAKEGAKTSYCMCG